MSKLPYFSWLLIPMVCGLFLAQFSNLTTGQAVVSVALVIAVATLLVVRTLRRYKLPYGATFAEVADAMKKQE